MKKEQLLAILLENKGQYCSGESMSKRLGMTRSGIWKIIAQLREEGYEIDSAPNRGYSLLSSPNRLEKAIIAPRFTTEAIGHSLECFDSIDSTNTEVKRRGMEGGPSGLVILAEEQVAGRGRRGRSFYSPKGTGLYLSCLLRPQWDLSCVSSMTAWVAVAVMEGIFATCGIRPSIKWTNDLLLGERKVCGILCELELESDTGFVAFVVVGIGVNVGQTDEDFPEEIRQIASSLSRECGKEIDRNQLATNILLALNQMVADFPHQKEEYLEKYRENCLTIGRDVEVIRGNQREPAKALRIDEEFRVVLAYSDGRVEAVSTGEVSLRGSEGYI